MKLPYQMTKEEIDDLPLWKKFVLIIILNGLLIFHVCRLIGTIIIYPIWVDIICPIWIGLKSVDKWGRTKILILFSRKAR